MFDEWIIRILLLPFALVYGLVISVRNFCYRIGIFKRISFDLPVISVGNLTIGGAGKTPHLEFLIRWLDDYLNIATLSRGYGRKTAGFRPVSIIDTAVEVGDEPLQFKRKFPNIAVSVGENRALAIPEVIRRNPETQVVLLDDAFQHLAVRPGLNILLTEFDRPFSSDWLLPAGRLREWRSSYKRADLLIVSKCPPILPKTARERLISALNPMPWQSVFFSFYQYSTPYELSRPAIRQPLLPEMNVLLISAIAGTSYLLDYLKSKTKLVTSIEFADHHFFEEIDLEEIKRRFSGMPRLSSIILTTEKDATRLELHQDFLEKNNLPVYVLPIEVAFHDGDEARFRQEVQLWLSDFRS
jgi:tetraacyldisaccharide 4'-kinase